MTVIDHHDIVIEIGRIPVRIRTSDLAFLEMLKGRYAGFLGDSQEAEYEFDVELAPPLTVGADEDVRVFQQGPRWSFERGDFRAEWDPALRTGLIHQSANPYAIDAILRIVHTLVLSGQGGFLVHAASAVRNGKAFLFAGASGAGKTTISRFAPPDAILLTDEISYVRKIGKTYRAFGTPFAGELAQSGDNICAPLETLYLLAKGSTNRIEPICHAEACRELLANILFFAEDEAAVKSVFDASCRFIGQVPVCRLTFAPDASVWEMIG
jgi:hypothetical protein